MKANGWTVDILLQGYPGKTLGHGGLGWSTVALLRGHGRNVVLDTGSFGARKPIIEGLAKHGLQPSDITDLLLSHLHYDHIVNWPMFTKARIATGAVELDWARDEPHGTTPVAELYVQALQTHASLRLLQDGDTVLPGITTHLAPGHTPGHLIFVIEDESGDILLVQDAAKYRCELLTRSADMTYDPAVTRATIEMIWEKWRRRPGSILLTGHDLPLVLHNGEPVYRDERHAGITAFFGATMDDRQLFDLSGA
jgi:N-acyl homoserine lactone hydrolase